MLRLSVHCVSYSNTRGNLNTLKFVFARSIPSILTHFWKNNLWAVQIIRTLAVAHLFTCRDSDVYSNEVSFTRGSTWSPMGSTCPPSHLSDRSLSEQHLSRWLGQGYLYLYVFRTCWAIVSTRTRTVPSVLFVVFFFSPSKQTLEWYL